VKDIFGPSDKSGHVSLVLDVSTDSKVLGLRFEEGVSYFFHGIFLGNFVGFLDLNNQ
jgi:hypothetical protein